MGSDITTVSRSPNERIRLVSTFLPLWGALSRLHMKPNIVLTIPAVPRFHEKSFGFGMGDTINAKHSHLASMSTV